MEIQKHNSNITVRTNNSLSEILKTDDKVALIRYVGTLSMPKVYAARQQADELEAACEYLANKIANCANNLASDANYLTQRLSALSEELEAIQLPQRIRQMDDDTAIADITLLILDCEESLMLARELSVSQVQVIAASLAQRLTNFTIEDVAMILHAGRTGQYGTVYRLDLNTVQTWVNRYLKEVQILHATTMQNRHLASKEGMSYDPKDKSSVVRVSKDRGIDTDTESRYQADKAEWLENKQSTKKTKKP